MPRIKNQQIFHCTKDGKRTICGLSNQHKDADGIEKFQIRCKDENQIKLCCKKCQK